MTPAKEIEQAIRRFGKRKAIEFKRYALTLFPMEPGYALAPDELAFMEEDSDDRRTHDEEIVTAFLSPEQLEEIDVGFRGAKASVDAHKRNFDMYVATATSRQVH